MVQFLVAIIEWMAIFAFSVVGVDYTPGAGCSASEATEIRQAAVFFTEASAGEFVMVLDASDGDCGGAASFLPIATDGVELRTPVTFDS